MQVLGIRQEDELETLRDLELGPWSAGLNLRPLEVLRVEQSEDQWECLEQWDISLVVVFQDPTVKLGNQMLGG